MMYYKVIFWLALAVVFYTYLGYGMLLWLMVRIKRWLRPRPAIPMPVEWPEVTLLICAYNEADIVDEKMRNCHALDYPKDRLHIVWVTDGSNDETVSRLQAYPDVQVLHQPERRGKTAALNRSIPLCRTELVVMCDANALLCPQALRLIVQQFEDPKVGCVSGEKRVLATATDGLAAQGEGAYWRYESALKRMDSELASTMGAAGELFAIRRHLYHPVPEGTLLDDFVLSLQTVIEGYRIAYTRGAYACELGSASMAEEQKRKVRIAAGGVQSIGMLLPLLNPLRYGIITFQLVSHRYLRWTLTPVLLLLLLPLNMLIVMQGGGLTYQALLFGQACFYAMAALGLRVPRYFLFMNWNVLRGFLYLMRRRKGDGAWEKARRATAQNDLKTMNA